MSTSRSISKLFTIVLCAATFASVAAPQGSPTFEAADIRLPKPAPGMTLASHVGGGPGTANPGELIYENAPLRRLLEDAFAMQSRQIQGPDWLSSKRFDVRAKVPAGATREQAMAMLQNLLRQRFRLQAHQAAKDLPQYALTVAKGGMKMKPSSESPLETPEGFPKLLPAVKTAFVMGTGPAGQLRISARRRTMADLAKFLTSAAGRNVVDETGLPGAFDFTLEFMPEPGTMRRADGTPPAPAEGDAPSAPEPYAAADIFHALPDQLGLKLDSRNVPTDILVIDHIDSTPTQN